jgi:hypothetical protein
MCVHEAKIEGQCYIPYITVPSTKSKIDIQILIRNTTEHLHGTVPVPTNSGT